MTVIAASISNLSYFVLGVSVGWIFARAWAWTERRALHQETPMPAPNPKSHRIDIVAIAVAVAVGLAMILVGVPEIDGQPLWDASRKLNRYVGPVVVACLLWRLIPMALDRRRWRDARALHLLAWWGHICIGTGNATAAALVNTGDAEWPAFLRLVLNLVAIGLSVWWPHPVKYDPSEGRR